jgi:hypothetical protein
VGRWPASATGPCTWPTSTPSNGPAGRAERGAPAFARGPTGGAGRPRPARSPGRAGGRGCRPRPGRPAPRAGRRPGTGPPRPSRRHRAPGRSRPPGRGRRRAVPARPGRTGPRRRRRAGGPGRGGTSRPSTMSRSRPAGTRTAAASRRDRLVLPLELRPSMARTVGRPATDPARRVSRAATAATGSTRQGPAGGSRAGGSRAVLLGRAWARARAMARALRIGQQVTVSMVMAAKLHQKGAVSP